MWIFCVAAFDVGEKLSGERNRKVQFESWHGIYTLSQTNFPD